MPSRFAVRLRSMPRARMRTRRGIAMLAALWLVVAIAAVAAQFALTARERRLIGIAGADRGRERAIAAGALATVFARMDYDLMNRPRGQGVASLRASDPWLGIDSIYSGTIELDSVPVTVVAQDLGATLNVNQAPESELRLFLSFVLGDATTAERLTASIMDWRDQDDQPRVNGAEYEDYIADGLLVLPTNGMFRDVDDLIHVRGMTPEILEMIRPYITTYGSPRVNLNTAPEPVLRALPGMSDLILGQILSLRAQGRRIESLNQVMSSVSNVAVRLARGRGGRANDRVTAVIDRTQQSLNNRVTVDTRDVLLTFYVSLVPKSQPTRLRAYVTRNGSNASLRWQLW